MIDGSGSQIRGDDSLEVKTSANRVSDEIVDGVLLFYVPLSKELIMNKDTVIEVSVIDDTETPVSVRQRMGDWLSR
jgi:hypothetical protein